MSVKFAVITPTYNRPDHLIEAIKSVLAQTHTDWLHVICNDCSTVDYSKALPWLKDPRVRYVSTPVNGGCHAARNRAIDEAVSAGAEYLTFLDDEEQLVPECLEIAARMIQAHPEIGWFISNTTGEKKISTRQITREGFYDWIDDYMYGPALRGDKTHVISVKVLGQLRLDQRYRASNIWRFRLELSRRTRIWCYPFNSKVIQYLEGGITKGGNRYPRTWLELYSRFARHLFVIRLRPTKSAAYVSLVSELAKTPKRAFYLLTGKVKPYKNPPATKIMQ
jgi:glycosyltransferase involved in cell wall biosynthesis